MDITYNPAKNDKNIADRGLSFASWCVASSGPARWWLRMPARPTPKRAIRRWAKSMAGSVVVFTVRGESLRIISLRKANAREVARYEKA
ncbi:BrnT family toxin [Bordetella bronchiseptica]|uniref:BrnT family toxin n=1 Tax=Bordetella bronchiseptica TaxID=518 RepID=UPI0004611F3D|nr:BrnT family toxin [Bordetella bronchiseptica]KDC68174.1 PF04365 family protein [Bordetella bronchiseptica MBORD591]